MAEVEYGQQGPKQLSLVIGERDMFVGRNRLRHIQLDWKKIAAVSCLPGSYWRHAGKYNEVVLDEHGTIKPFKARLIVHEWSSLSFVEQDWFLLL